jgi:glycosyltransferase involved in cell wall biosynthesis
VAAFGRVNPRTYDADPTLRSLIDVVPFGTAAPVEPPPGRLRAAVPAIGPDDDVLYWAGGIYNWFDPATLVRATARLRAAGRRVHLVLAGGTHPNPDVPSGRAARTARAVAAELGELDSGVHFLPGWVDYADRAGYLADATLGVSTHLHHVETEFSFRTRLLDHLWAGLPTVTTAGDTLGELIAARGAGWTVPPGDVDALAGTIARALDDRDALTAAIGHSRDLGAELRWEFVAGPLLGYCSDPSTAPDLLGRHRRAQSNRAIRWNTYDRMHELTTATARRTRAVIRRAPSIDDSER